MSVKTRLAQLQRRQRANRGADARVVTLWDGGDGTCTNTETGAIVTPGPDAVRLRWPEDRDETKNLHS